jgi:hypothetical protein
VLKTVVLSQVRVEARRGGRTDCHCIILIFFISPFQPAHVKACFIGSNLTVPVSDGKLNLGTWQGVWLCEHRDRAGSRKVLVTVNGALRDPDRTPQSPSSPIASTSS